MKYGSVSSAIGAFNEAVASLVSRLESDGLTGAMIFLTDLGSPQNLTMFCIVLGCMYWLHKKYVHMIQFVLAMTATALVTAAMKMALQVARPETPLIWTHGFSFPSGHTSTATALFVLLAYTYRKRIRSGFWRKAFVSANVLAIVVVGFSRLYLNVHHASDVIAGILVGLVVTLISIIITELRNKEQTQ